MKQKKAGSLLWRVGRPFLFLALFGVLFGMAEQVLKLNTGHRGTDNVKGFYAEEENSIEVLFIGASTMFCTADPLVLYEEYGIASYDFGSSAQPFELSYLYMQEALRFQKPKVIALEVLSICNELDVNKADSLNYGLTDLPFSMTKAAGVADMFRSNKGAGLSYLIPMVQFKDRWQELSKEDFLPGTVNYAKGAYTPDKIAETPLDFSSYYEEEAAKIPDRNLEIFHRMVTLCQENQIQLLLFKSPNVGWNIGQTKAVEELAASYELPFLNYYELFEELEIDVGRDFRDNTHFNRYGSAKASSYLGQYLKEHYALTDYRMTDAENSWDLALEQRAHDRANEQMSRISSLPEYMSAIPYQGHTVVFSVSGETPEMEDFLQELAAAFSLDGRALCQGGSFAVQDGVCISPLLCPGDRQSWQAERGMDILELTGYSIAYNREIYQLVDNGLTILIYDDRWGQLVDVVGFSAQEPGIGIRP